VPSIASFSSGANFRLDINAYRSGIAANSYLNLKQVLTTFLGGSNGRNVRGCRRSPDSFQHPTFCPERTMPLRPTILEAA
jgi:hypothetical protein